ncbi:efflux RND transporter periplasmic adaptor subunit [Aestuariibaculum sp. M13]|uniref:efflux RND transporter periplasmic adaptor subunit n=1 Tax=Aestuariibaculum sp. M13 TaxID=2967132 RepID=UPI002159E028|nr:efflux RND transporter periplasmic adaptor subunit [Aestuariibaculum sp. M13]MCR8667928.1 efflux RND transporter periplasmic adaptor subunit [Aestuariibaculum sp. M13]
MKKIYTLTILSLAVLFASCGSDDKKSVADNRPAIAVTVNQVSENGNSPFLAVSGKIKAENSATLSTRTMGYINNVLVNVGDNVKKGQLLVAINNTDLQAKKAQVNAGITEATAAFNNAEKDYNRFKSLYDNNSASQKEFDDMTARYEMAKARLEGAKQMENEVNAQFAYTNITAPFSGVVTSKMAEKGDMANPGQPLITVEAPGSYEVMAMVPETEISAIKKGTEATVLVKSINQSLKGKVTEVSTSASQTGGQYLVKVVLEKTDANILSGMFTTVQFPVERKAKTAMVLIPSDAVINNGQLSGVYTVSQSNTAILRWLRLGRTFGDQVEVLSGLSADESYIVSAEGKLYNGAKISIQ